MAENIKQLSNAFSLGGGLNINSNQPIDSRFKVQSLVELTYDWKNKNNGGEISKYEGLLTYVEEVGKTFRYRTGASYTQGETTIANWELVPVSADDINSLIEIPEVVYPEYELVAGDTNSIKLVKDGEVVDEVSISLTADVVTTTEENTEKVTALSLATEQNIGKIILVKTAEGDYLAGTYIVDGVGSVKYLATTTGTVDDGDVDAKINSAIDSLDSTISANENEYLTSITIENGKLVSSTSAPVPTYTAGDNISIEDNVISALGYTFNVEKESFSVGGGIATGQYSYAEGSSVADKLTGYNWELNAQSIVFDSDPYFELGTILKIENNGENLFVKVIDISDDRLTFTVDKQISLECDNSSLLYIRGVAYDDYSHAEGLSTTSSGWAAHSEGSNTTASGKGSHSEGGGTIALGNWSHAEGFNTIASGEYSHTEGRSTNTKNKYEHAQGQYNVSNKNSDTFGDDGNTIHSIGIGAVTKRKNAQEVMQNGDFYVINVGGYDGTNPSEALTLQEVIEDISAYEAPEYTIFKTTNDTSTEYKLQKDGVDVAETIIVPKSEIINKVTVDNSTTYEIEGEAIVMQETLDANYKIKDVIAADKVLAVDVDGKLSSTINLVYEQITEGEGEEAVTYPAINLYGKDSTLISTINASEFVKDGFLSSASYDEETHKLTLIWNTDSDIKTPTVIDLSGLVDVHDVVGGDGVDDLVKIEVTKTNENGVLTFTVSANETNLQNKLDEIDGKFTEIDSKFIESVTAPEEQDTLVKVIVGNNDTQNPVISLDDTALDTEFGKYLPYDNIDTIKKEGILVGISLNVDDTSKELSVSLDETKLGIKITDIEERITELENAEDADTKCELATINAGTTSELTEGEVAVLSNTTITLNGDGTSLTGDATAVKVVTKQYVTGIETALDERITALENEVDDDTKCESATINAGTPAEAATEGEVTVLSNTTITLSGDGTSLTGTATAVNVVTKQYVDGRFDSLVDNDTKCESATINADAEVEVPTVDEVDVLKNVAIDLSGDGTSLTGTATAVKVVTKQYVDGKFAEVPTYTAITTSEIDGIFTQG